MLAEAGGGGRAGDEPREGYVSLVLRNLMRTHDPKKHTQSRARSAPCARAAQLADCLKF